MGTKVKDLKEAEVKTHLVSFISGHYKKIKGVWLGDSVWGHFKKPNGNVVHINKDQVEYIETMEED